MLLVQGRPFQKIPWCETILISFNTFCFTTNQSCVGALNSVRDHLPLCRFIFKISSISLWLKFTVYCLQQSLQKCKQFIWEIMWRGPHSATLNLLFGILILSYLLRNKELWSFNPPLFSTKRFRETRFRKEILGYSIYLIWIKYGKQAGFKQGPVSKLMNILLKSSLWITSKIAVFKSP